MNPLDNLHDIHQPAEIGVWPLAYGWWIATLLTLLLIVLATRALIAFFKRRKAKKQALKELANIDCLALNSASQINQIVKRVAICYFPTVNVHKLHSAQWAHFLTEALPKQEAAKHKQSILDWQNTIYQKQSLHSVDNSAYQEMAQIWIKKATPPSQKTINKLELNNA